MIYLINNNELNGPPSSALPALPIHGTRVLFAATEEATVGSTGTAVQWAEEGIINTIVGKCLFGELK